MDSGATIEAMRTAARALASGTDLDAVRAIQAAQDALDTAKAARLASIEQTRAYELEGASSLSVWVRNELRLSAKQCATLVMATSTLTQLPAVAAAAEAGLIRAEHVAAFTYGIKHIGAQAVTESESWLLDVAQTCEPNELLKVVRALREAIYPDELDKAWAEGMDRQDIQVNAVPGGWHVTGFLSADIGAKFKTVLDSVSTPTDPDDARSGSERRVDGFDTVLNSVLESGLPSDKGIRPHLSVILDTTGDSPAQLSGYGSIGPRLLDYLTCGTDITPIHTRNGEILDVGRMHRLATLRQRRAVLARQDGECAAPGCHNTHLEIHHTIWWSRGGTTNLDNLVGLCTRCHHLVHRDLLVISGDAQHGLRFTNRDNRALKQAFRLRVSAHRNTLRPQRASVTASPYSPMRM